MMRGGAFGPKVGLYFLSEWDAGLQWAYEASRVTAPDAHRTWRGESRRSLSLSRCRFGSIWEMGGGRVGWERGGLWVSGCARYAVRSYSSWRRLCSRPAWDAGGPYRLLGPHRTLSFFPRDNTHSVLTRALKLDGAGGGG